MSWYLAVLKNYATFKGRARRKEFWMFALIHVVILIALNVIAQVTESQIVLYIFLAYWVATIIPQIAVSVRRLHDTGRSGFWYFISLVPLIGGIWLLVLLASEGRAENNSYGANPKLAAA